MLCDYAMHIETWTIIMITYRHCYTSIFCLWHKQTYGLTMVWVPMCHNCEQLTACDIRHSDVQITLCVAHDGVIEPPPARDSRGAALGGSNTPGLVHSNTVNVSIFHSTLTKNRNITTNINCPKIHPKFPMYEIKTLFIFHKIQYFF